MDWLLKIAMTLFAFVLPVALASEAGYLTFGLILGGVMAVATLIALHFIMKPSGEYDSYDRY